jgi:hypothetical protein
MELWSDVILEILPSDGRAVSQVDLEVFCSQKAAQSLDRPAFSDSIKTLLRRKLVQRDATSLWRIEPDFEERALEDGTESFLRSEVCLESLRIRPDFYLLEKTTTAQGAPGAGRWSRPDFTLAAIRRFKYDPRRYLDVYSFELKNRRGTNVVAVHEALAHARFSHFAYLVCPRAELGEAEANIVRQEAMQAIEVRRARALQTGLLRITLSGIDTKLLGDDLARIFELCNLLRPSEASHGHARLRIERQRDLKRGSRRKLQDLSALREVR